MKPKKNRLKRGDRKDGRLVREADAMHRFTPYLLPLRTDNEAVLNETLDLQAVNEFLAHKNLSLSDGEYKYTLFHVICAALAKVIRLRPEMNRFIKGYRLYERNEISFSFVIKKKFDDVSEEGLAIVRLDNEKISLIEDFYLKTKDKIYSARNSEKTDGATDIISKLVKLPRFMLRIVVWFLNLLDYHGKIPTSLSKDDPYYTSVFVSNLGSIKMHANYHHLANYGTNSFFVVINEKKLDKCMIDGEYSMKETVELCFTIDERIADGVYFAKSIKLLKYLFQNPELLDLPIDSPVNVDIDCGAPQRFTR